MSFILDIEECISHTPVPARNLGALQIGPEKQSGDFMEDGTDDFD
jgi:hypothetical protein